MEEIKEKIIVFLFLFSFFLILGCNETVNDKYERRTIQTCSNGNKVELEQHKEDLEWFTDKKKQ